MEEVDLDNNWIGDGGGRELALALQERKDSTYCNNSYLYITCTCYFFLSFYI